MLTPVLPGWIQDHDCHAPGNCWHPDEDGWNCANCKARWPQCVSQDSLACMFVQHDTLTADEYGAVLDEIIRRGLPLDLHDGILSNLPRLDIRGLENLNHA